MKNLNDKQIKKNKDVDTLKRAELNRQNAKLSEHSEHLVQMMYDIIRDRNIETMNHIRSVQGYTRILAEHYARLSPGSKMTSEKIDMIVRAAGMHDIGKIVMPDMILSRQGSLSESELEQIKEHTLKGSRIVKVITELESEEYSRICCNICLYHHEKYDGSGYPMGLRKDRIPIEAQLVALADMYDAMVNSKIDQEICSKEKAYYMLMNGECGELSPRMRECLEDAKADMEDYVLE